MLRRMARLSSLGRIFIASRLRFTYIQHVTKSATTPEAWRTRCDDAHDYDGAGPTTKSQTWSRSLINEVRACDHVLQ